MDVVISCRVKCLIEKFELIFLLGLTKAIYFFKNDFCIFGYMRKAACILKTNTKALL